MDLGLKGKSVIVTAASKGIGRATAAEFAREGAHVLLASRSGENLKTAKAAIIKETQNEHIDYIVCDMKDPEAIEQMVAKAAELNGTVDVLINNAGGPPAGKFMDMGDEDWQHAFELNLLSFIRTTRAAVPYMQKQKQGHIVNLASSSIKQSIDNLVLSNTMRPGIVGLAKSLSQELGQDNILVNTIGPGTIETDRIQQLNEIRAEQEGVTADKLKEQAERSIPAGRYGQPEEFAKAVVFLASDANTYITGQSFVIDGGALKTL